jgi:hypothetical protein
VAAKSTKRKKKRSTRTTDPAQSARFLEMAKKMEVDETGEQFAKAMEVLVPKKDK